MTRSLRAGLALTAVLWAGIALPHLVPWPAAGWDWYLPVRNFDDELYYAAQLNHFLSSGRLAGNAFLAEHEDAPYLQPAGNEAALGVLLAPFYPRWRLMAVAAALLLAAGVVFLGAGAAGTVTASRWGPWLGAALVAASMDENLDRVIHPQADCFLLLLAFFWAARRVWTRTGGTGWAAAGGLAAGALAYGYPFYGLYADVTVFLLMLWALRKGDSRARPLAVAAGVAFVVSLPYAWHNLSLRGLPQHAEVLVQNGFLASRFPSLRPLAELALASLLLPLLDPRDRPFFGVSFLAGLLCAEQHMVTGLYAPMTPEHFQHAWRLPLALAVVSAADRKAFGFLDRRGAWLLAGAALAFFAAQAGKAADPARAAARAEAEAYLPAARWLRDNAKGAVVVAADGASSFLAAFAPVRTFTGVYAYASMVPQSELAERKLLEARAYGLPKDRLRDHARELSLWFWGYEHVSKHARERAHARLRRLLGRPGAEPPVEAVPAEALDRLAERYAALPAGDPFAGRRADFLVYGPWEERRFPGYRPPAWLEPAFDGGTVRIWRVKR